MKASTMAAVVERLGVLSSFSRPRVSNDSPIFEAPYCTLKQCPPYSSRPFVELPAAPAWVDAFLRRQSHAHIHGAIRFVTPEDRHTGREAVITAARQQVYEAVRAKHPWRWRGTTRNSASVTTVQLKPTRDELVAQGRVAAKELKRRLS